MKPFGNASYRLLLIARHERNKPLTPDNLEHYEANADAGGSGAYHLLKDVLLDMLPFEKESLNEKELATLLAFNAIMLELDELGGWESLEGLAGPSIYGLKMKLFDYLDRESPVFLMRAWAEAMNDDGWSYHRKTYYVITDGVEQWKDKYWIQKGKRKLEVEKMKDVIIAHVSDLIEFHIRKLALIITQRVTIQQWLQAFNRPDTPSDREWMQKRLNIILHH